MFRKRSKHGSVNALPAEHEATAPGGDSRPRASQSPRTVKRGRKFRWYVMSVSKRLKDEPTGLRVLGSGSEPPRTLQRPSMPALWQDVVASSVNQAGTVSTL